MEYFAAGVIVAWIVEWLLFTFWWRSKATTETQRGIVAARGTHSAGTPERSGPAEADGPSLSEGPVVTADAAPNPDLAPAAVVTEAGPVEVTSATEPKALETTAANVAEPSPDLTNSVKTRKAGVDLRSIAGLGPKTQELLSAAGFQTLEHIANADPKDLKAVLETAGSRFALIDPASWPEQARFILAGDSEGLRRLQEQLKKQ